MPRSATVARQAVGGDTAAHAVGAEQREAAVQGFAGGDRLEHRGGRQRRRRRSTLAEPGRLAVARDARAARGLGGGAAGRGQRRRDGVAVAL